MLISSTQVDKEKNRMILMNCYWLFNIDHLHKNPIIMKRFVTTFFTSFELNIKLWNFFLFCRFCSIKILILWTKTENRRKREYRCLLVLTRYIALTARDYRSILQDMFPGHLILREDVPLPFRFPDLSHCDYFLWGYLLAQVLNHRPCTVEELKYVICEEIARIPTDMLAVRAVKNFQKQLHLFAANILTR